MTFSMAARVLTVAITVAAMIIAVTGSSYAYTHRAKAKFVVAAVPQYVHAQPIKMRYYGGPKGPMYP